MANATDVNPIYIDTVGEIRTIPAVIQSILVRPTAAAWLAVLHDASGGDVIFEANNNLQVALALSFPQGFRVTGIWATTLTNCKVLVYLQ